MNSIDICNMALSFLNCGRINSIDDTDTAARLCKINYNHLRRRLLRMYPWGFAEKITKLALFEAQRIGYLYAYAYPEDCLLMHFVFDEDHASNYEEERQDFRVCQLADAGQAILTNVEKAYACYTSDIKQTQRFSAEFVDALSHLLASSIAMTLTGNTELQSINLQLAQQAVDLARYQDATERERHTRYPHQYSDARFM